MQQAVHKEQNFVNGVNVTELFNTIDAIKADSRIADFNFRAKNKWVNGSMNVTTVDDYDGALQQFSRETPFVLQKDEPEVLLGTDKSASPVEYLLAALAGCMTTSLVYHAAARGIQITEVESSYEGNVDLRGFLGLDEKIRNGYRSIKVAFKVKGNATEEQLRELVEVAQQRSPMFDVISNGVPVTIVASV